MRRYSAGRWTHIKACIKSHFSDVFAPCQAVLLKAAAISKVCSADVKKVCADVSLAVAELRLA
jgi:hypothetical protein